MTIINNNDNLEIKILFDIKIDQICFLSQFFIFFKVFDNYKIITKKKSKKKVKNDL